MKTRYLLLPLMLVQPAWAESEHRDHGAHVHGHASLNLTVSGNELVIELNSPAMNLLGFEHRANTARDKKTLQQAVEVLRNPSLWLQTNRAASCQLEKSDLDSTLLGEEHHDDGHSDAHEDESEGRHEDDHDEHEGRETHADFELVLHYHCDSPGRLQSLDLSGLFRRFTGIEEIDVQWITESHQSATELNPNNTIISLP